MKVAVIGAGAMGCLFAAKLVQAGNQVLLVDHDPNNVNAIRKNGVRVTEGKTRRKADVPIRKSPGNLRSSELILIMVKAYQTEAVAKALRGRIGQNSAILTLQNGLGNMEVLSRTFGDLVLAGSTTEASLRVGPGEVLHTGRGRTLIGELDGESSNRALNVVKLLRTAGFACLLTRRAKSVVWSKAVLNSAINPVSALTRLRNGQLRQFDGLRAMMLGVLDEGVKVARAERVRLNRNALSNLLQNVLRLTARNRSSMFQDILNGKTTEVRQLNGAIANFGVRHGIATPLNSALFALIVGLENAGN